MAEDGTIPIGVFIDSRDGLEGLRVMIVEVTASDRVVMRPAEPGSPLAALWVHFTGGDLDAAIMSLFRRRAA